MLIGNLGAREYKLNGDNFLISKTDLIGRITYANPAFFELSGLMSFQTNILALNASIDATRAGKYVL